jgi:phospholipase C
VISALASSFATFDAYHASVPGPTFPNRLFALSGTSYGYGDNDDTMTVLGWPQRSIFGALSATPGLADPWRVYFSDVPSALLLDDARNLSDLGRYRLVETWAADCAKGDVASFTWVEPGFIDIPGIPATDQHPAHDVLDGERFLKSVYEPLRASPIWNSTLLLVTYDEHGGFCE